MTIKKMQLYINNKAYDGFSDITYKKSFLNIASSFTAQLPLNDTYKEYVNGNDGVQFPIILNASIKIYVDKQIIFNGYLEKINVQQKMSGRLMNISGRSITADLIDTTVNRDVMTRITNNVTLKQICQIVLKNLNMNIDVIETEDTSSQFTKNDYLTPQVGQSVFDFLNQYAKKKQIYLSVRGDGTIKLIRSTDQQDTNTQLLLVDDGQNNNILESDTTYDSSKLYYKYICHAQNNLAYAYTSQEDNTGNTGIQGQSIDNAIRTSRISNFISDTNLNSNEATDRAKWQDNFNASQFFIYNCKLAHITYDNENIWDINQIVQVIDDYADVDSKLLISEVAFSQNVSSGVTADLKMVIKDSYSLLSIEAQRQQLEKQIGSVFRAT